MMTNAIVKLFGTIIFGMRYISDSYSQSPLFWSSLALLIMLHLIDFLTLLSLDEFLPQFLFILF